MFELLQRQETTRPGGDAPGFEVVEGIAFAQSWLVREAPAISATRAGWQTRWAAVPGAKQQTTEP